MKKIITLAELATATGTWKFLQRNFSENLLLSDFLLAFDKMHRELRDANKLNAYFDRRLTNITKYLKYLEQKTEGSSQVTLDWIGLNIEEQKLYNPNPKMGDYSVLNLLELQQNKKRIPPQKTGKLEHAYLCRLLFQLPLDKEQKFPIYNWYQTK